MSDIGPTFPVGETLESGSYRIIDTLFGFGDDRVHLAIRHDDSDARFLVSGTARAAPPASQMQTMLDRALPGVFTLVHVGSLDVHGKTLADREARSEITAVVERLPAGEPLRKVVSGPVPLSTAAQLAVGVSRILVAALQAGCVLEGVRPENIWATRSDRHLEVTGLSRRGVQLFRAARPGCFVTHPPYTLAYLAPEDATGRPQSDRTLTFIVGTLLVEWITGSHPFPDARYDSDALSIAAARHVPFTVPAAVDRLIRSCLSLAPTSRPLLDDLLEQLKRVAVGNG